MKCPDGSQDWNVYSIKVVSVLRHNNLIDRLLNSCDQPGKPRTVLYSLSELECFPGTSVIPPLSSTQLINAVIDKWWLPDSSLVPSPGAEGGAPAISCQTWAHITGSSKLPSASQPSKAVCPRTNNAYVGKWRGPLHQELTVFHLLTALLCSGVLRNTFKYDTNLCWGGGLRERESHIHNMFKALQRDGRWTFLHHF